MNSLILARDSIPLKVVSSQPYSIEGSEQRNKMCKHKKHRHSGITQVMFKSILPHRQENVAVVYTRIETDRKKGKTVASSKDVVAHGLSCTVSFFSIHARRSSFGMHIPDAVELARLGSPTCAFTPAHRISRPYLEVGKALLEQGGLCHEAREGEHSQACMRDLGLLHESFRLGIATELERVEREVARLASRAFRCTDHRGHGSQLRDGGEEEHHAHVASRNHGIVCVERIDALILGTWEVDACVDC